jgi:Fe-S-cluster containining protein
MIATIGMTLPSFEQFTISLKTPTGEVSTAIDVPLAFVPIASIVPLARRLGQEAVALEEARTRDDGERISCQKGCAACCRMLVPVSAPEALALKEMIDGLPDERRHAVLRKLSGTRTRLEEAGLLARLTALGETESPLSDDEMEPINQEYYALRLPCPFLDQETCSIYEHRPAACRELLVTSPPELCDDLINNPVRPLPVPIRVGPALALLWSELKQGAPMLIPLPLAVDWAHTHPDEAKEVWKGAELMERMLAKVGVLLEQEFAHRKTETGPGS